MKYHVKSWLAIVLFLVMTVLPCLIWPLVQPGLAGENTENRNLSEAPALTWEGLSEWPSAFEAYLDDHLPFRSFLIRWNSAVRYYGFHSSVNENVALGKDGWLFYTAESVPAFNNGEKRYSEDELALIAANMQGLKDALEARGIPFVLMIAPNKERMYAEYLPDEWGPPAQDCALFQVTAALEERTDVKVVCPYETLMNAQAEYPDRLVYHKTDTHWNDWGAYLGVQDLLRRLYVSLDEENVVVTVQKDTPGDLADMLNLSAFIDPGETCVVSGYETPGTECTEYDFFGAIRFVSPSMDTGKLLMSRDSFCSAMAPVLGQAFSESCLVHVQGFTPDLIDTEQPDIFVLELVERSLDLLLDASHWMPVE